MFQEDLNYGLYLSFPRHQTSNKEFERGISYNRSIPSHNYADYDQRMI